MNVYIFPFLQHYSVDVQMTAMDKLVNGAIGIGVLGIIVAVVLAILQGFQGSGALTGAANTSITTFISGMTNFATFAAVIVLTIIGFFVIRLVKKSQGQ